MGFLGGMALAVVGGMVGRGLAALGIAFVTYYGVYEGLKFIKQQVKVHLLALPPEMISILAMLQVGKGLTIIFSCMFAHMLLNGLTGGGTIKKLIFN